MIVTPQSDATRDTTEMIAPEYRHALLPPGVMRPFVLVTGLFFLWGIPNAMNDVLIRQFMKSFSISRFEAGLVQSAFYMGYFVLALPAGMLMKKHGYKSGLLTGLGLVALGCFLFYPAANLGQYGYFLAALFIVASGLAFLETASNPFVAQLGPTATSEQRLNLAQAFNPVGYFSGVLVGTIFIFSGVELSQAEIASKQAAGTYAAYTHMETLRVVSPYLVLGCLALLWAVMIGTTKFPAFLQAREHAAEVSGNWRDLLHQPHFMLAVISQFCYCAAQVGTWSFLIQYCKEYAHTTEKFGGLMLAVTIGIFGVGRFAATALMRRFSGASIMLVFGICNGALLLFGMFVPGWAGLIAIMATAFFLSLMFPTNFALGLKDVGANTNIAGSFIVMAIVGGGVMTPVMGWMAGVWHSTALSYAMPMVGNLAVAAYAFYMLGYQRRRAAASTFEI